MTRLVSLVLAATALGACKKNVDRAETGKVSPSGEAAFSAGQAKGSPPPDGSAHTQGDAGKRLRDIVHLDAAGPSTCALDSHGRVYCWGVIESREPENGHRRPVRINGLPKVRDLCVAGRGSFNAIGEDDRVYQWGLWVAPYYEPLPAAPRCAKDPNSKACNQPPRYELDPDLDPELAQQKYPDEVFLVDDPRPPQLRFPPQLRHTRRAMFTRIESSGSFIEDCVILEADRRRILIPGPRPWTLSVPRDVAGLAEVIKDDTEVDTVGCTISWSGTVRCAHRFREDGPADTQAEQFKAPTPIVSLGIGGLGATLALADGRAAYFDGFEINVHPLVRDIVELDAESQVACGIDVKKQVVCWVHARRHEYGHEDDPRVRRKIEPKIAGVDGSPKQITTSALHRCVLLEDGRVQCWGSNSAGQCGAGRTDQQIEEPTYVLAPEAR